MDLVSELLPLLGLQPGQVPLNQINSLLGSSYFIGMELPGRQALYSSFEFHYESSSKVGENGFQFHNLAPKRDNRLNRISISGRGTGIRYFCLVAFERPKRIRYEIERIRATIGQSELFKDKVVFISGATRGFGSVLTKIFALQNANLIINYRSDQEEAEALAYEIRPWSSKSSIIAGDASKVMDCQIMGSEIKKCLGKIDVLICNAAPPVKAKYFLEQESSEFLLDFTYRIKRRFRI